MSKEISVDIFQFEQVYITEKVEVLRHTESFDAKIGISMYECFCN